jgi:hypothetical protein
VNNEVHTFVVDDQDHPKMTEICAELKRLSGLMHDAESVPYTLCCMLWMKKKKKKRCFTCVTNARNWLLHLGSSAQLLVLHSEYKKYVGL